MTQSSESFALLVSFFFFFQSFLFKCSTESSFAHSKLFGKGQGQVFFCQGSAPSVVNEVSQLVKVQRKSTCRVRSHRQDISIALWSPRLRDHKEEGTERPKEPEVEEDQNKIASSGQNSTHCCNHKLMKHPHKVKPVKVLARNREEFIIPTPSWGETDSWWLLGRERGLVSFKGVAPGRLTVFHWMVHTQEYMLSSLDYLTERGQEVGRGGEVGANLGGLGERNGGWYDQNMLHEIPKELIKGVFQRKAELFILI